MDTLGAFGDLLARLDACEQVTLEQRDLVAEDWEIDEDREQDVVGDGEFALDDGMRAFFGQVREVHIAWSHADFDAQWGHPSSLLGRLDVGQLDDICFSRYTEADLQHMGPRNDAERAYLLELRHINTHSRSGDQWLAFRSGTGDVPEIWWRSPSLAGIDVRLNVDFEGLLGLMLKSHGVLGWPLLCADLESLDEEKRAALLFSEACDASWLARRLEHLASVEGAGQDAAALMDRLAQIRRP